MSITLKGLGSAVDSVNGKTGIVVLSPEDLGADSAGAASAAIAQHEAAADPHPQYLTETEADAKYAPIGSGGSGGTGGDPAGTAAALLAAHEAAADPHPQYLTQSEGDALYQPIGSGGSGTSEMIRTPVAVAPLTGTTEFPVDGILQASSYAPLYSVDTREFREFQIDTATGDFTNPVAATQVNADTWAISPVIPDNTDLQWRCRDKSVKGDYSEWSEPQAFKTYDIYVVTPVITSPTEGGTVFERDQPITSSEFQIVNGIDTHAASYWTIKNSLGAVVYQTGRDTVNLTSWQPPAGVIVDGESMTVEVIYESMKGIFSEVGSRSFVGVGIGYGKYLAVAHDSTPYLTLYGVDVDTLVKIEQPSELPPGNSSCVVFSPDGTYMAVGHSAAPRLTIYKRTGDVFVKLNQPSISPSASYNTAGHTQICFSPDGIYLVFCQATTPFINIYKRDGDTFNKLPNPTTLPSGDARSCSFSPNGEYLAIAHNTSPFMTIYKRDGDTFNKIVNPDSLPAGIGISTAFSPDSNYLVIGNGALSPLLNIYKRSGDTFTRLPDPADMPASTISPVFSPDGNYLVCGINGAARLIIYKRDGDTFNKLPNPTSLPSSAINATASSGDGRLFAFASLSAPFIHLYARDGDVFSRLPDTSIPPSGVGRGVTFWPSAIYPPVN